LAQPRIQNILLAERGMLNTLTVHSKTRYNSVTNTDFIRISNNSY